MLWTLFLLLKAKKRKGGKVLDSIFKYKIINEEIVITGLQEGVVTTSIVIPETIDGMPVVEIKPEAFQSTSITDIKIGENIREIGIQAFYMCKKLKSVTWHCQCDVIPTNCFLGCSNLASFNFAGIKLSSVTWNQKCDVIPSDCFAECSNLTQFDFSNVKKIGLYAFYKSGLQEVCLTENIEVVSEWAFYGCEKLSSVIWNCKCDVIPTCCFSRCSNLTQFDFLNVKKIGAYAFDESGLTFVTLNKGTAVEQYCFARCNDLEKIEWLSGRAIKDSIFEGCKHIKEIFISDSVKNIEASAFASSPNAEITFV